MSLFCVFVVKVDSSLNTLRITTVSHKSNGRLISVYYASKKRNRLIVLFRDTQIISARVHSPPQSQLYRIVEIM
jgi:hypothetical protein